VGSSPSGRDNLILVFVANNKVSKITILTSTRYSTWSQSVVLWRVGDNHIRTQDIIELGLFDVAFVS
jgi:hypothetical protein